MTCAVDRGRIDPIDAHFQRTKDRSDGIFIVLRPPGKFPAGPTNGPSAKANRGNFQIRVSKLSCFHLNPRTRERDGVSAPRISFSLFLTKLDEQKEKNLRTRKLGGR